MKSNIAILIAVFALVLSGLAIYIDNCHYQEITKPHTKHDEIYSRLVRLDDKIDRTISLVPPDSEAQTRLANVETLRDQAELAWDVGDYEQADKLIIEAHTVLERIRELPPPALNWSFIGGIIGGVIVVGLIIFFVLRRRAY